MGLSIRLSIQGQRFLPDASTRIIGEVYELSEGSIAPKSSIVPKHIYV